MSGKEVDLYIEDISFENSHLTILLHKNSFPFYLDENERKPYVKIVILNYNFKIPVDDIRNFIDYHNDGLFFEINDDKTTITFSDFGERLSTLSGSEILVEEMEYNSEQLWEIIIGLRRTCDSNSEINSNLNKKIDKISTFIDKEIDRNRKLLFQIGSSKVDLVNKTEIKIECWNSIKSILNSI